jgi:hypothetical protein
MTLRAYRARTPYSYGPFYDLLVERFPEHRMVQHVFDVPRLGQELPERRPTACSGTIGFTRKGCEATANIALHARTRKPCVIVNSFKTCASHFHGEIG